MIGAVGLRDAGLLLGADHGDRLETQRGRDLQCGDPDTAGGAVHQHGLAGAVAGALVEGEVHGEVVHQEARPGSQRHRIGQREHRVRLHRDGLLPRSVRREDGHPLPGPDAAVLGCATDHARALDAEHERQFADDLVAAGGLQQVRERHSGGVQIHDHEGGSVGFVDLGELDSGGAGSGGQLLGIHVVISSVGP